MKLIGIIGGVASGKSVVAKCLAELGAAVLDADAAGHAVLLEPQVEQAASVRWGNAIFTPDGHIDRRLLAAIVFGPGAEAPTELKYLESLTHPRIRQRLLDKIAVLTKQGIHRAAVLDAPVLLKAGWDELCDAIVYVDAPHAVRQARALQRGWTAEEFARREGAQESLPEKQARADKTIDNSGSLEHTRRQVRDFWGFLFPGFRPD
ncbi:MAG: dephospho-CoA kinase [Planctomycetes bacterium]|nr:dephospho-CoA kinase [Planctomycetota bacterium]